MKLFLFQVPAKKYKLLFLCMLLAATVYGADSTYSMKGRVFDSSEPPVPLPGVTVAVKNTSRGMITDVNGNFDIKVSRGEVLVFSYAGYKTQEYIISSRNNISISITENISELNQVVITGYSEQKAKHLANAISTLDVKKAIQNKPITQLSQALQGGVTGLTVMQGTGLPGSDGANILIRGISSLGGTAPLVLVDGVPFSINDVDPTTVESITVLKDAAAASIYGARGANGVILVTTKRGVPGKVVFTYDGYMGIQQATYMPKFVDAPTYMRMSNEAYANIGGQQPYTEEDIRKTAEGNDPLNYPNTNWSDLILKKNPQIKSHTVGISGGNDLARFAVNANYLYQDGITPKRDFERFSFRANTGVTLTKNLSMLLDLVAVRGRNRSEITRFSLNNLILREVYNTPPNIVPKYPIREDGLESYGKYGDMQQPLAEVEKGGFAQHKSDVININFQPQWAITPALKLRGQYLYKVVTGGFISNRDAFNFIDYHSNALLFTYPTAKESTVSRSTYNYIAANLEYSRTFGKSFVYALGGLSRETDNPSNFDQANMASYFVKVNYVFNDKYLFESTVRADGSSRFGPGQKWGTFPSVALGWNVHNEGFLKGNNVITHLKLRSSYGLLGNNMNAGFYRYQSLVNAGNGLESSVGNPYITWETVNMLDIGGDISLFKDLSITVDWFDKITNDILLTPPLSLSAAIASAPINAGKVQNRGWEFSFNYAKIVAGNIELNLSGGYSYYSNKILSLVGGPYLTASSIDQEGYPIRSYYLYRTEGLLQEKDMTDGTPILDGQKPGDIKYLDVNKDGVISEKDKQIAGNPNPQGNYFANLRIAYKGFELETQVNGFTNSLGYYSSRYQVPLNLTSTYGGTPMIYQTDYWTPQNTDAAIPRLTPTPTNNVLPSDYWLVNASFVRIRYIQLGYSFQPALIKRAKLNTLRVYINAQNPFTFSSMKYLDPESRGDEANYPLMKVFTFGINAKF